MIVHDDAEALQRERRFVLAQMPHQQQRQRAIGHLVGEAVRLALLDIVQDGLDIGAFCFQIDAQRGRLLQQRRLARQLADHHARVVAHCLRLRMLVGFGETRDGAGVQAALVRERAAAGVGMMRRNRHAHRFGHEMRDFRQLAQAVLAHRLLAHLQLQVGDGSQQVGVAHALTQAVHRALHLRGTRAHRRQCVGHRAS